MLVILDYPQLKMVKELKRFLEMCNFFRRFIKNASEIMSPLFEVTKSSKLNWTDKCTESFETLKHLLASPPILAYPDFKATANDFIVTTDASNWAAGATLSQIQNNTEVIIAYASSAFSAAERGYSAIERELAAIRFAVKHFREFLYGRQYVIRTDHKPLIYLSNMKQVDGRLMRTLTDLNIGKYTIEYVPGKTNVIADSLSRIVDLSDCLDVVNDSYKVDIATNYVTVEGGPSSMFKCLSYSLYGNVAEHSSIRSTVIERLLKTPSEFGMSNNRSTRRTLQAMKSDDCLPCWQALLAFAKEYHVTVVVYQDGVGVVSFPAENSSLQVHLHSLGGVHFNLMEMKNNTESLVNCVMPGKPNRTLYKLENDEIQSQDKVMQSKTEMPNLSMCAEAKGQDVSYNAILSNCEIKVLQTADTSLHQLMAWLRLGKSPEWIKVNCNALKINSKLASNPKSLTLVNDLLLYEKVPIIPDSHIEELVKKFHVASGHMGRDKTLAAMRKYYYHVNITKVVTNIINECTICQEYKGSSRGGEPQFKRQAAKVYEQYAIDLLELEPARGNVKYLLVGVDVLSRFMNAIPIKDKCARTVATALEQRIFPTLARIPDVIISDNGPEFRAKVFEELLLKYSIKHFMTIPHFPQSNGRVERVNRTLQLMLATACAESGLDWLDELSRVLILYNHSKHTQTGKAPCDFLTEHEVKLPLPGSKWREATSRFKPYHEGDLVGYKLPSFARRGKLSPRYQGPCRVVGTDHSGLTYNIICRGDKKCKKTHYNQLKPWYGDWEEDVMESIPDENPTESLHDGPGIVTVNEQLQNRFDLGQIFRMATQDAETPHQRREQQNSPRQEHTVEDEATTINSGHQTVVELPAAQALPPPSPAHWSPIEWADVSRLLPPPPGPPATPESSESDQSMSPQMLTRNMRRRLERKEGHGSSNFRGFDEAVATSTPRKLEVLKDIVMSEARAGGDTDDEDEIILFSRCSNSRASICSTCGTSLGERENCSCSSHSEALLNEADLQTDN